MSARRYRTAGGRAGSLPATGAGETPAAQSMADYILVFAEQEGGALKRSAAEACLAACALAEAWAARAVAVTLGAGAAQAAEALPSRGIERVLWSDAAALTPYAPGAHLRALEAAFAAIRPRAVLMAPTAVGRDLAPRLAARVGAAFASDALELHATRAAQLGPIGPIGQIGQIGAIGHRQSPAPGPQPPAPAPQPLPLQVVRPVFGGRFRVTLALTAARSAVITLRPRATIVVQPPGLSTAASRPAARAAARLDRLDVPELPADQRAVVKRLAEVARGAPLLTEAQIVVCGGRGMGSREGFALIRELADVLGGAPAASRAAVDAGLAPPGLQVGQSGKTVSPALYLACGVSGSLQHLAGMRTSRCVAAINSDAQAPIFRAADYGIAGDVREVLPALIEEARRERLVAQRGRPGPPDPPATAGRNGAPAPELGAP